MFKSGMQTIFSTQGTGSVSVSYRPEEKVGKGARSLRFWLEVGVRVLTDFELISKRHEGSFRDFGEFLRFEIWRTRTVTNIAPKFG